jgi:hypothetical protein
VKWLERKHDAAVRKTEKEYLALRMQAKQELCDNLGFDKAAAQMQEHLDEALAIWSDWKKKIDGVEGISTHNGHYSLDSSLYPYTGENRGIYKQALNMEIVVSTAEIKRIEETGKDLVDNINRNYMNVIAVVQSFKTTKEAAAYLKELGFDLTELENPPAPITALTVQINTNFLFINKDAA